MNRLEKWFLKRICETLVVQSSDHHDKITYYYRVMTLAAAKEFSEDNKSTLNSFLSECHEKSLLGSGWVGDER